MNQKNQEGLEEKIKEILGEFDKQFADIIHRSFECLDAENTFINIKQFLSSSLRRIARESRNEKPLAGDSGSPLKNRIVR